MKKVMKRNILRTTQRLVMAGVFSGAGFYATSYWYDSVKSADAPSNTANIARIIDTRNEVQRKRAQRTIWQGVDNQIELGAGDSVRTGPSGGARIEFVKSKAIIELDPDSLVIIEEKQGKVALDFLKGNLFVKNGEGDQSLTVTSGAKEIDLSKGDVALGRGASGDLVQTDLSGTGPVKSGGFQILSPRPFATFFIDPTNLKSFNFSWVPLKDAAEVKLQIGASPSELVDAPIGTVQPSAAAVAGKISSVLKVGVHYWRLAAYAKDASGVISKTPFATSNTMKLDLRPRTPPIQIYPLAKAHIRMRTQTSNTVTFNWSNPAQLENLRFELAQVINGKPQIVHTANLSGRDSRYVHEIAEAGDYSWRVSGVGRNAQIDLAGTFLPFNASAASDLAPPTLVKPANNERLPVETVRDSGLYLSWKPIADAVGYKVTVRSSKGVITRETPNNSLKLAEIGKGEVNWSVEAVGDDKTVSKPSDTWKFRIEEIRPVEWANLTNPDIYWYVGAQPQGDLFWNTKGHDDVKTWRIRTAKSSEMISERPWQTTNAGKSSQTFPKDDEYVAEVEGLNANGFVTAKSSRRKFSVKLLPLPTAPVFADSGAPGEIKARGSGDADFAWRPVERASMYAIRLTSTTGLEQEFETSKTQSRLDQLKPGNYTLVLFAKDSYGRRGPASIQRPVTVPPFNDRKAPRLSKIKVK
jgi:hypothetical protein